MSSVKCIQSGSKAGSLAVQKAAKDPTPDILIDNQDQSFTLNGVDSQGASVDISTLATITAESDNTDVITVDPPAGMTVQGHAVLPGTATITFVATFNDGSIGPFTVDLPVTVTAGGPTGLIVTPGTPTIRE